MKIYCIFTILSTCIIDSPFSWFHNDGCPGYNKACSSFSDMLVPLHKNRDKEKYNKKKNCLAKIFLWKVAFQRSRDPNFQNCWRLLESLNYANYFPSGIQNDSGISLFEKQEIHFSFLFPVIHCWSLCSMVKKFCLTKLHHLWLMSDDWQLFQGLLYVLFQTVFNKKLIMCITSCLGGAPTSMCHFFRPSICLSVRLSQTISQESYIIWS